MKHQDILLALKAWFAGKGVPAVDENDNYFEAGHIDSFAVITLVEFMETSFAIRFDADDFQDPAFYSLNGLAELIVRKRANG